MTEGILLLLVGVLYIFCSLMEHKNSMPKLQLPEVKKEVEANNDIAPPKKKEYVVREYNPFKTTEE